MINIRYHIVSITAVFLALGIGVALGSTFLDRATVDYLDRNIRSAENRIRETNEENERLEQQLDDARERDESLIVIGSEDLLADQLSEQPVLVVSAPGVDPNRVDALTTILERSGADLRGTMALQDDMTFSGDVDADLAEDLGLDAPTVPELRGVVYDDLTTALLASGPSTPTPAEDPDADPDGTTTTTADTNTSTSTSTTTTVAGGEGTGTDAGDPGEPDGTQPAIVDTLVEHGYLKIDPGPGLAESDPILETAGYRYVFVGGPGLDADQNDTLVDLLPAEDGEQPLAAVVITATQPAPVGDEVQVPTVVARVRGSEGLAGRYTTVDNADTFAGLVAAVQSLSQVGDVDAGHYGQGDGAAAVLPPQP